MTLKCVSGHVVGSLLYLQISVRTWYSVTASVTLDWICLPMLNPQRFEPSYAPLIILQLYLCSSETQGQRTSWRVLLLEWDLKPQTAFCPHTQLWKPWDHWESSCWHWLALKCVSVFMSVSGLVSSCKCLCQWLCKKKMCPFSSWLLKWHEPFPSPAYGCWNLSTCILPSSSCTPHYYFWSPTFVSSSFFPTVSFIVFPQLLGFNPTICPPDNTEDYLICGHCFNHTNLSISFRKVTGLRFNIRHLEGLLLHIFQCLAPATGLSLR